MLATESATLQIVEGRNLAAKDAGGTSDPYCEIRIFGNEKKRRTAVINKSLNPIWNAQFEVPNCSRKALAISSDLISISVWDKDPLTDDFLGECSISGTALAQAPNPYDAWLTLKPRVGKREHVSGEIHVRFVFNNEPQQPPAATPAKQAKPAPALGAARGSVAKQSPSVLPGPKSRWADPKVAKAGVAQICGDHFASDMGSVVQWAPNGKLLVTSMGRLNGSAEGCLCVDDPHGDEVFEEYIPGSFAHACCLEDNRYAVVAGPELQILEPNLEDVLRFVTKSPQGMKAGDDNIMRAMLAHLLGNAAAIYRIASSGTVLLGGRLNGKVAVYDLGSGPDKKTTFLADADGPKESPDVMSAISFTGTSVACGVGKEITLWTLQNPPTRWSSRGTLLGHVDDVMCLSQSGKLLASGSKDTDVRLWDMDTKECLGVYRYHQSTVLGIHLYQNCIFSCCGVPGSVVVWDPTKTNAPARVVYESATLRAFSIHVKGEDLAFSTSDPEMAIVVMCLEK